MLEITETAIIRHLNVSITILEAIHELGIGVAIDDFGSGYSSLSQLKMLPVDALKIDQSFIADVVKDADSAAIMQAIIQLGAVLGLTIIAEGVETAKQLNFLKQTVCHCGQGYYLSHPLLEGELIKLLQKQHP